MAREHADDGVDVRDHPFDAERAVEELTEQRRLADERVVAVARPLEQPRRPVLAVVDRHLDLRGRVLGPEAHEIVAALDVVVEPGHAHAEALGHRLHRHPIEPDLVGGAGDHRPVEPGRAADLRSIGEVRHLWHIPKHFPNRT